MCDAAGFVIFEDDSFSRVQVAIPGFEIYSASAAEFFATENATRWTFAISPDGRVQEVVARSGNSEIHRAVAIENAHSRNGFDLRNPCARSVLYRRMRRLSKNLRCESVLSNLVLTKGVRSQDQTP